MIHIVAVLVNPGVPHDQAEERASRLMELFDEQRIDGMVAIPVAADDDNQEDFDYVDSGNTKMRYVEQAIQPIYFDSWSLYCTFYGTWNLPNWFALDPFDPDVLGRRLPQISEVIEPSGAYHDLNQSFWSLNSTPPEQAKYVAGIRKAQQFLTDRYPNFTIVVYSAHS